MQKSQIKSNIANNKRIFDYFSGSYKQDQKTDSSFTNINIIKDFQSESENLRAKISDLESNQIQEKYKFEEAMEIKNLQLISIQQYNRDSVITLGQLMFEYENLKEKLKNEEIKQSKVRFGEVKMSARNFEDWNNGFEHNHLIEEKTKIELKIEELKKEKKDDTKKRNSALLDHERRECNKIHLNTLTKKLEEITEQIESLIFKKNDIILKDKRFANKSHSFFFGQNCAKQSKLLENKYQILCFIGRGGYAEVYKAFDLENFQFVVLKLHIFGKQSSSNGEDNHLKHVLRENDVLKQLNHHSIIRYIDEFEYQNIYCTVFEFCEGEDLDSYLKKNGKIPEKCAKIMIKQILFAVRYLNSQSRKIIHYDLKPHNIMITNDKMVKILDFGLCKVLEENNQQIELTSRFAGTYWYLPPECFDVDSQTFISSKVDVWSISIIFYQMLYNKKPFGDGMTQSEILAKKTILNITEVVFPECPIISNETKDFIRRCLAPEINQRIDIFEAVKLFLKIS